MLQFDERPDLARGNGVWDLGTAEAAEMAKLAETTYRDVNIGLANQFGSFAARHGIDVDQVIDASNSQPYSHIHRPGIAVGGHCIPVYPRLYLWNDPDATVVAAAREANAAMPAYTVGLAVGAAGGDLTGATAVVLGASYRGGVKETAFSGVFATVAALRDAGANSRGARPDVHRRGAAGPWVGSPSTSGSAADVVVRPGRPCRVPRPGKRRPARSDGDRGRSPHHEPGARSPEFASSWSARPRGASCERAHRGVRRRRRDRRIGDGSAIWHLAQVREGAVLGRNCIVGRGAYVGPGVQLGDNCKLQNYALVYEPAVLEDGVFVGPAVVFTNDHYPRSVTPDGTLKSEVRTGTAVGVTCREGSLDRRSGQSAWPR